MRKILTFSLVGFVVFCALLVFESGFFKKCPTDNQGCILLQQKADTDDPQPQTENEIELNKQPTQTVSPIIYPAPAGSVILGAADPKTEDPESGYRFQLELTSKGAAINKATFSNGRGKGFDDRDYKDPQPLVILSPVAETVLSMANKELVFVEQGLQLPLDKLHWHVGQVEQGHDTQTVSFETVIKDKNTGWDIIKLIKTYKVTIGSYQVDCDISIENLSADEQKLRFNLQGPTGIGREGVRADMRTVMAGFRNTKGQVTRAKIKFDRKKVFEEKELTKNSDRYLWSAVTNKYFAAILVPLPDEGKDFCDWIADKSGRFYNPDAQKSGDDENVSVHLKSNLTKVAPSTAKNYKFQLYLGPKDKRLFTNNQRYRQLGFVQTIDFMSCCCFPAKMIAPLAFGILAMMEWMYDFIPNYGVVIIILVFLIRLVIHPLTKKSQVSMSTMQKLGPKIEEIKKKYANNKAEISKQTMVLYKEQGASPITGMLPMFVQMPIWISLYSAIYASISLRGAAFLPFWITDLSAPDALFRFSTVTIPLVGWEIDSFNLLPILMGFAFYFQQKLMPKPATAGTNPQIAQQQKMMMVMMPLLFPLMLYKAPSGLNLYIMASTFAGVIEQKVIRKHISEKEEAESKGLVAVTSKTGGKVKKKKPKPFFKT